MNLLSAIKPMILALLGANLALGQAAQAPDGTSFEWKHRLAVKAEQRQAPIEDFNSGVIKNILRAGSPVEKGSIQLHGMGDEASVILLKISGSTATPGKWTDDQKRTMLEIINKAFEHPDSIINPSDVAPNATNLLLCLLADDTEDPEIKKEISQTKLSTVKLSSQRSIH
jgi:hypothetical protein